METMVETLEEVARAINKVDELLQEAIKEAIEVRDDWGLYYSHPEPAIVDALWDDVADNVYSIKFVCSCGKKRYIGDYSLSDRWQCDCGEYYYCDPAGRIWGTQALINAGMIPRVSENDE